MRARSYLCLKILLWNPLTPVLLSLACLVFHYYELDAIISYSRCLRIGKLTATPQHTLRAVFVSP